MAPSSESPVAPIPGYIGTPCAPSGRGQLLVHHSLRRPRVRSPHLFAVQCKRFSLQPSCARSEPSKTPSSKKLGDRDRDASHAKSTHGNGIPFDSTTLNHSSTSTETHPEKLSTRDSIVPEEKVKENGAVDVQLFGMPISIPARWLLFSVPFMWGSFGPAVRLIFSQQPHLEPSVFNTARLLVSSSVYLPILLTEFSMFQKSRSSAQEPASETNDDDDDRYSFVKAGIELGIYVFLANVAQVLGLQEVSAARAAFLVQLQTVIVPVLSGLLGLEAVGRKTWISSIIAVAGVALLSLDKGHGATSSLYGDGLEILSALFFSTYVIRLGRYCNTVRSGPLVATKILVQAVLSSAWAFVAAAMATSHTNAVTPVGDFLIPEWTLPILALNVGVVAWTGLISSAASGWAQTKGQQKVPASDAVVIFATQPLWASAIAAVLLGESFGPRGVVGGSLIVASTLVASVKRSGDDIAIDSSAEKDK